MNGSSSGHGIDGRATSNEVRPWMFAHTCSAIVTTSPGSGMTPASTIGLDAADQVGERPGGEQVRPLVGGGVRRAHEHDAVVLGVLDAEAHVGLAAGLHGEHRVLDPDDGALDGLVEQREVPCADLEEQMGLVLEVAVDRRRRHPGGPRHRPDRHLLLRARLEQQPLGGLEDLLAQEVALGPCGRACGWLSCHQARTVSALYAVAVARRRAWPPRGWRVRTGLAG